LFYGDFLWAANVEKFPLNPSGKLKSCRDIIDESDKIIKSPKKNRIYYEQWLITS